MITSHLDAAASGNDAATPKVSVGRQALRREVNQRIRDLNAQFQADDLAVFCECGRTGCSERLTAAASTYDELRRVPTHFLVKRGHVADEDRVVGEHDQFVIVEVREQRRRGGRARTEPARTLRVHDASLRVEVPDEALAVALSTQLQEFDVDTVAVDGHWELRVNLLRRNPESRVESALHAIDAWLLTAGVASLCVHLDGRSYMLHAPPRSGPAA